MEQGEPRVVEVEDERTDLARAAIELIQTSIWDVQPAGDLLSEIEERRRGLPSGGDYHLIVSVDGDGKPAAAAAGVFLEAVNAGFITYLAVREELRGQRMGRELRAHLVRCFRDDARRLHGGEPAWTVGEVRRESAWLRSLVRGGRAIPFDFGYFHPWMPLRAEGKYVLYREPMGDARAEVPAREVARLLFAIWRRAYRIRFPLQSETFCYMLRKLEGREMVGADPRFADG
ncbi:MAG TPA: GNAT family N-acetyltransferase [Longimicrobiaceae bacterium]